MEMNKQNIKELYPGIKIRKKIMMIQQQLNYLFFLNVQDLKIIDFQADFTGSQNISIRGYASHQRIVLKTVEPRQDMLIAQIQLHQGWKLKTKFRFLRRPISKQKQLQYISGQISTIQSQRILVDTILKNIQIALTPIQQISQILRKSKVKFIDYQFPPQQISIVGKSDKNLIDDTVNHWRRPADIFQEKTFYIIDRIHYKNLIRGKLGDNALFSVLVALSLVHPVLIERLFLGQKQISQEGIYRLKFCKNGQWQTVTIDDFFPCQPLSGAKFISSHLNEIWIMLIEKAYAKLHKRYLALHQLQVSNAFNDLTGCPTYIQSTQSKDLKNIIIQCLKQKHIVVFYNVQQKQFKQNQFIPLRNYAYPILGYQVQDNKFYFKFLSHSNTQLEIDQQQITKSFRYICICKVGNWQQVRIKGKFVTIEAGQSNNSIPISLSRWYYSLELPQPSQLHVCLHQQDILISNNSSYKQYLYCSLLLLQKSQKSILKPMIINNYSHNRQIQFNVYLQPGYYIILPFVNSQVQGVISQNNQQFILDIFKKLDLLMYRQLKYAQLVPFYKIVNQIFDLTVFSDLLKKYTKGKKGIGFQAFKQIYNDNKIYWAQALQYYNSQRLFTLSIHSKFQINVLIKNNIGTQLNNRAHCQLISQRGQQLPLNKVDQKVARVKFLKSKCHIVEYLVQNKFQRKIQIQLDCSDSHGYIFVPRSGKFTCLLDSGQRQFIMKLIPIKKIQVKDLIRKQTVKVKVFE